MAAQKHPRPPDTLPPQAHALGYIFSSRYHKTQWATRFVERLFRGHMARKRNGGRLAEIRAKRKADEEVC